MARALDAGTRSVGRTRTLSARQRIRVLTLALWAIAGGLVVTTREPYLALLAGSLAIGWSNLAGRCGLSHFGALAPRASLRGQRRKWVGDSLAYLLAGALASTAVGLALGGIGTAVPARMQTGTLVLALVLALVAMVSELGLVRWRLPEPPWQTRREWAQLFRSPVPAVLWGFCLGLTFATVFTFSGAWLVLAAPIAVGDPAFGAMVLLAHWVGRSAPLLVAPFLLEHAGRSPELLDAIEASRGIFRTSNIGGVGVIAVSLTLLVADRIA